jgi:hypothetical protein
VQDCKRNSLQMLCQQHFSHKELQGKNAEEQVKMLQKINIDWLKDVDDQFRLGSMIDAKTSTLKIVDANYDQLNQLITRYL